jgi:hypothetical protein
LRGRDDRVSVSSGGILLSYYDDVFVVMWLVWWIVWFDECQICIRQVKAALQSQVLIISWVCQVRNHNRLILSLLLTLTLHRLIFTYLSGGICFDWLQCDVSCYMACNESFGLMNAKSQICIHQVKTSLRNPVRIISWVCQVRKGISTSESAWA